MSLRLRIYVALVVLAAIGLLSWAVPQDVDARWGHYAGWVAICMFSETMWLTTVSGQGTVSMSSAAGLAAAMLWGQGPSMWIVAVSVLLAELFVARKALIRAAFNSATGAITMWAAAGVWWLLGGPLQGLESLDAIGQGPRAALGLIVPVLGMIAAYLLVNRTLVTGAVAWSGDRRYLRVLREDWLYTERLLDDFATFFLSPLMVIAFEAVGYVGVLLFYAPLRMLYESNRRYLELHGAQAQLIHSERMAAKGEMAAEIGHELRNQLVAISGRAQMLIKDGERKVVDHVGRHAQIILEQSRRMEALAKGMTDFSRAELQMERVDVHALIHRSVEFVRTQNRFDGVEWDLRLAEPAPHLMADPGQLQQVLLNLFLNAADAMKGKTNGARRAISITTTYHDRARQLRVVVTDTGTGIAPADISRIFEPRFTTKPDGHGFGLSTSYRIITSHGGRIQAESPPGAGASFTITLPMRGAALG
ncbi:MAG: hypothetical protein A2W00_12265 [Candidatus Eisenbacteria bacterium RBG_16_71_46]|nr:MAG: hypothetical protein A2W00_12265 [Candidatus Eisenbacteria bacterium RBG_16_71_46]